MFSKISWHGYCLFTGYAMLAYYVFVGVVYYRSEIFAFLKSGIRERNAPRRRPLRHVARGFSGAGGGSPDGMGRPPSPGLASGGEERETKRAKGEDSEQEEGTWNGSGAEDTGKTGDGPVYFPLGEPGQPDELDLTGELAMRITSVMESFDEHPNKEAVVQRLGLTLAGVGHLSRIKQFRQSIDWHIQAQVQLNAGLKLEDGDLQRVWQLAEGRNGWKPGAAFLLALLCSVIARAQNGNGGITSATSQVKGYFSDGCNLMYAIGAIVGLVGAVKVFNKWNSGDPDTSKTASAWFGSCIFLVVVATILKAFFNV